MKTPKCKKCGRDGHYAISCLYTQKQPLKIRKPLKQVGKKTMKWLAFRRAYLKNHPPNHEGYYECYLCLRWIPASEITLDHIVARSKRPDLVFVESNLDFACGKCNSDKGSKSL